VKKSADQRGFALIVVVLLVGLLSVSIAAMLDLVGLDAVLTTRQAQSQRALSVAEAGVYETITSQTFGAARPRDFANPVQTYDFPGGPNPLLADSVVSDALDGRYTTEVALIGMGPVRDCNQQRCARLSYDVTTEAELVGQAAQKNLRVRLDQLVTISPGRIMTPVYER